MAKKPEQKSSNLLAETMSGGIRRVHFTSVASVPVGHRIFPDSVLISKRFMTRFADELLVTGKFNVEFIARECAKRDVRAIVARALANDTLGRAFRDMHKTPNVDLDTPIYSKSDIYNALRAIAAQNQDPGAQQAAAVLTEVMLHVLEPLGIVDPMDRGYATMSSHFEFFPSYEDLVTDIWAREIEKTLSESRRLDVGTAKKKIGASVVATRLAAVARDLRDCIEYVGDYAAYASDALVLVRAHLLPRQARNPNAQFFPSELIDHPVIKAMASNLTIARMALSSALPTALVTTAFLMERLPQVAAFFFESKRYVKVSLADFKNHFIKSTYRTAIDRKLVGACLSYNLRGAPAAQAITESPSLLIQNAVRLKQRDNATKAIASMYGSVLSTLDTASVHNTYRMVNESMYQLGERQPGDPYLDLILPECMNDVGHELIATLAAAIAVCDDGAVLLCEAGGLEDESQRMDMGDTEFQFMYAIHANENYIPNSGVRSQDMFHLTCAHEVVAIAEAWEGTTYLADKMQIAPDAVLGDRAAILGDANLDSAPVRGYAQMSLEAYGSRKITGGFQFVGAAIRKTERDAVVVKPILNATVVDLAFRVLGDLLIDIDSMIDDQTRRVQMKRYVFAHLNRAATSGMGANVLQPYVDMIKQQCMTNVKREATEAGPVNDEVSLREIRTLEALLDERSIERCMQLFVFEQVLQLLNLSPVKGMIDVDRMRTSPIFDALKSDRDFSMVLIAAE